MTRTDWAWLWGSLFLYSVQWMFASAVRKCKFCCIFTVWLLSDCNPAVFQSTLLGQVTGLLQRKSNQANPQRSLTILSVAALLRQPSVTHTAHATRTYNELFDRYGDGHMHINHLTSCELGTDISELSAKAKHWIPSSYEDDAVQLTLHSDLAVEVAEMNLPLGDQ